MELINGNFEISKMKNGQTIFKNKRINDNIYETPNHFRKECVIKINDSEEFLLNLNKVFFKKNEILFRFNKNNLNLPKNVIASITYKTDVKKTDLPIKSEIGKHIQEKSEIEKNKSVQPTQQIQPVQQIQPTQQIQSTQQIQTTQQIQPTTEINHPFHQKVQSFHSVPQYRRNPALYTNVESGYSAVSFPSVYIARYKYGPQGGKFQTTPQVALGYLPR